MDLRRQFDRLLEDRAGLTVLRALQREGHSVANIRRPDRTGGAATRKVDFLVLVDGIETAIEVVRQMPPTEEVTAEYRFDILEDLIRTALHRLSGPDIGAVFVSIRYRPEMLLRLGRKALPEEAQRFAKSLYEALQDPLIDVPYQQLGLRFESSWLGHAAVNRHPSLTSSLNFTRSTEVDFDSDDAKKWARNVASTKGRPTR
jgi:hypothetical protein